MKLSIDKESDALYFRLNEKSIMESEEVRPGVVLDFDKNGRVIGVEFLKIRSRASRADLSSLEFKTA